MDSGLSFDPLVALRAAPLVSTTCSLLYAWDQHFFLGLLNRPENRATSKPLLQSYFTTFFHRDDSQLDRRATAASRLNITTCRVTVNGWTGFDFEVRRLDGTLPITRGIPAPNTKNGQNIYDMSLKTTQQGQIGSVNFVTNGYLTNFPVYSPSLVDYATVSRTPTGAVKADLDISPTMRPTPPLSFSTRFLSTGGPTITYVPTSGWLNVILTGTDVYGWVWLEKGINVNKPDARLGRYYAEITGTCFNSTMGFIPPS
ncbi:hypothetical protein CEP54_010436 [Fusarium duplospermum]|uniref:Uncharacterized protein n=1 Tax=Fusarium duplospermum TaxID=1325734 RepID=A0A428PK65_9HYPO|nr:hypothetical protein CEP54_010436 [Fusarium duplospermum]